MALHLKSKVDIVGRKLSEKDKRVIDKVIKKVIKEYGEVLQLLGKR